MSPTTLNRRRFLKSLGLTGAALVCPQLLLSPASAAPQPDRKPNIVFIMADDLGLDGIGCYGGGFKTPNIDALAAGGTRFEYCYSAPVCGPSRALLLTGRYAFRTGMTSNDTGNVMDPAKEIMWPTVLKPAGYVTASVGKWSQMPLQPSKWGFDEYFRFQGSGVYRNEKGAANAEVDADKDLDAPKSKNHSIYTVNGVTKPIPSDAYVPDMMHNFLVDFITRHKDRPFCAYYPMSEMHSRLVRTPDSAPGAKGRAQIYADNIAYMDKSVGKLVAALDKLKLRESTIIIFTGDNGTAKIQAPQGTLNGKKISGQKGTMQEGGSRVPLIVNWKGTTPAGKVNRDLTDFSDFLPTIAQACGAPSPAGVTLDGHSFLPQIKGQTGTPREWVYVEYQSKRYVRDAKWKLNNAGELYDMKNAPYEELLVAASSTDPAAIAARTRLQAAMDNLVGKNAPAPQSTNGQTKGQNPGAGRGGKKAKGEKRAKRQQAQDGGVQTRKQTRKRLRQGKATMPI